jgi:hypothetical protein
MRKPKQPLVFAVLVVSLAATAPFAEALDVVQEGRLLLIRNLPSGNKVVYGAHDSSIGGLGLGSTGDPTCTGAGGGGGALRINDGAGNDFTIALPCAGWKVLGGSASNPDFKYKDSTGGTCTNVIVKHGRSLKVICEGPQVAYALGQAQGNIDVTLRLGSGPDRNCATFGPAPTVVLRDGSNGRTYLAKRAPQPDSCTSP